MPLDPLRWELQECADLHSSLEWRRLSPAGESSFPTTSGSRSYRDCPSGPSQSPQSTALSTPAAPALALTALKASTTSCFEMTNGFVALNSLLLLPVELQMQPLDPTPLLRPHYRPSSLIRVGPSQCSASVLSPRGFCHLCFSLDIRATGSRSSAREPGSDSRLLYAGRRLPSYQVSDRLVPGDGKAPGFDDNLWFTTLQRRFTCVRLSDPYLLGVRPRRFDSNAHHQRLLTAAAWSGLKPAPGSRLRRAYLHLPCSLCTVRSVHTEPPFRATAAHYPCTVKHLAWPIFRLLPRISRSG